MKIAHRVRLVAKPELRDCFLKHALPTLMDSNRVIGSLRGGDIVVRSPMSMDLIMLSIGPLLGAAIAIAVFLIQDLLKHFGERRSKRSELLARIQMFAQKLHEASEFRSQSFTLPGWLAEPETSEWSLLICKPHFWQKVQLLRQASLAIKAKLPLDKECSERLMRLAGLLGKSPVI